MQTLGLDSDWQGVQQIKIFPDLLLADAFSPAVRNENAVGDLERPDFRNDSILARQSFEDGPPIGRVFGRIARKAP
jgi:hypothetical protein